MVATLTSLTAHLSFINWSTQAWRLTSSSPHFPFHRFSGSNCSVLMCISRLLGPITWGKIWTLLYSLSFRLRTPSLARLMLCPVALHTIPFSRPPLYEAIGYCELGLGLGSGFGNHASHTCSPSESVVSFSVTPIQGDILHPKYAWTAFPRLVCAEGYNVTWKIKQRG